MQTKYAGWVDPEIMKIVPAIIPPFPPGMKVTLNDGTEAVTVGMRPENPYRPLVKRIEEPVELRLAPEVIDLTLQSDLQIDKVGGVPVKGMLPPLPAATPPPTDPPASDPAQPAKALVDVSA
jgi:hypothetical protein